MTMRPVAATSETHKLLIELAEQQAGVRFRFLKRRIAKQQALFEQIAERDELHTVPALANYLSASKPTRDFAADAIESVIQGRNLEHLKLLEQYSRDYPGYDYSISGWRSIMPSELIRFKERVWLIGLFSFHPNGWVRQNAIEELADSRFNEASMFLLLRVNDWVEPVRDLALNAIQVRLEESRVGTLSDYLSLIASFSLKQRANLSGLQRQFERLLLASPSELEAATTSEDFRTRRTAYEIVWRSDHAKRRSMLNSALGDSDPLVRLSAARLMAKEAVDSKSPEALSPLLDDSWYAIRLAATRAAISLEDRELIRRMVLDPSRAIRDAVRFYLRATDTGGGGSSVLEIYRDALTSSEYLGALLGLGDIGDPTDIDRIAPFFDSSRPRTVEAALDSYAKLSEDDQSEQFLKYLPNPHPRISRTATRILMKRLSPSVLEVCRRFMEDDERPNHVNRNAYRLLANVSKWQRLIVILKALQRKQNSIARLAQLDLDLWLARYNQSFVTLRSDEQALLAELVQNVPLEAGQRKVLAHLVLDN